MEESKPVWHFDVTLKAASSPIQTQSYQLLPAGGEDKDKVVRCYTHHPVDGYELGSVEIIYHPRFNRAFECELARLQEKEGNEAFAPKWDALEGNAQRAAIMKHWQVLTQPYTDAAYPAVRLFPGWHGTRPELLDSLFRVGYSNLSYTDKGFFGKGLYFAYEAEYAHRVYSQGALILNWVASFSVLPVIAGDMPLLLGKSNYGNTDAHFVPVVPRNPDNPNETVYYPCEAEQTAHYHELVVFQTMACLPRYLVHLQKTLLKSPPLPKAVEALSWKQLFSLAAHCVWDQSTQMIHCYLPVPSQTYWTTWQERITAVYEGFKQTEVEVLWHLKAPDDQTQIISVKATDALIALYKAQSPTVSEAFVATDINQCVVIDRYERRVGYEKLFAPNPHEKAQKQLVTALQMQAKSKVQGIIAQGVPLLPYRDDKHNGFLHLLAETCLTTWVQPFLQYGFRLTDKNHYGDIPLHYACGQANVVRDEAGAMASALIAAGSPVNTPNKQGQTPLMAAAVCGHVAAVRVLLQAGADTTLTDQHGQTALQLAHGSGVAQSGDIIQYLTHPASESSNCVLS